MAVPDDLRYTADHEWVRREGDVVRIGITDYAQEALGDVVYVALPQPGAVVGAASSFGEVESTKSVSDVYAPLDGEVVDVNAELASAPQRLNEDPYGAGWIATVRPADWSAYDRLLDAEAYRALVADA